MTSKPTHLVDSHIHLWPASSTHPKGHGWMAPGHHLTRQYSVSDYLSAASSSPPTGFVYVETDRYLPPIPNDDIPALLASPTAFETYIQQPLDELSFLRRIVEGTPLDGEGHDETHARLVKGIVAWAPVQLGREGVSQWIEKASEVAGEKTWALVKGFRFLLQGIKDEKAFRELALGERWLEGLRELGRRGFAFDVGVDQRQGGVWQLEVVGEMVEKLRAFGEGDGGKGVLVLNHLCKPDLESGLVTSSHTSNFNRWSAALRALAKYPNIYMKLSGAFSELGDQDPSSPWPADTIIDRMKPWLDVVFDAYGPRKIMFGSDWPVCCVRGPGDKEAWRSWREVVEGALEKWGVDAEGRERVWWGTAKEGYKLDL